MKMAEQSERNQLPPGWECRYESKSGRAYFINHFNRSTTWEDPRVRYWQYAQYIQSQNLTTSSSGTIDQLSKSIPLQISGNSLALNTVYAGAHGALQVYPTSSPYCNPQPAFLPPIFQDLKAPLSKRSVSGLTNKFGEVTLRSSSPLRNMEHSSIQNDVELHVAKINTMFPTVSETHIRLLLKKYYNRPALVVSALQVEKNPLCQPGPCTPIGMHSNYAMPRWRLPSHAIHAALTLNQPRGIRQAPHSPKMKLRYLKNVFHKVDEYILLDTLEQCENNVQKTTEKLLEAGYEKRNPTAPSRFYSKKVEEEKNHVNPSISTPPPRIKSSEEKNKMKLHLMDKFKAVPEKVILLAMDSVDYDEERAAYILDIMVTEESIKTLNTSISQSSNKSDRKKDNTPVMEALKLHTSPIKRMIKEVDIEQSKRSKHKSEIPKVSRGTSTTEDEDYKSPYLTRTMGPNIDLAQGANNDLLLPEYAPWSGPDPSLLINHKYIKTLALGRNLYLVDNSCNLAKGPNSELRKGSIRGLAQGSIYSQRNATSNTESRDHDHQTNILLHLLQYHE